MTTCHRVELLQYDYKVSSSFSTTLTSTHLLSSCNAFRPPRISWLDPARVISHSYMLSFALSTWPHKILYLTESLYVLFLSSSCPTLPRDLCLLYLRLRLRHHTDVFHVSTLLVLFSCSSYRLAHTHFTIAQTVFFYTAVETFYDFRLKQSYRLVVVIFIHLAGVGTSQSTDGAQIIQTRKRIGPENTDQLCNRRAESLRAAYELRRYDCH